MASGSPYFVNAARIPSRLGIARERRLGIGEALAVPGDRRLVGGGRDDLRRQHVGHRLDRRRGLGLSALVDPHAPAICLLLPIRQVLQRHLPAVALPHRHETGGEAVEAIPGDRGAHRCPLNPSVRIGRIRPQRLGRLLRPERDAGRREQHDVLGEHRGQPGDQIGLRAGGREGPIRGQQFGDDRLRRTLYLRGRRDGSGNDDRRQCGDDGVHNVEFAAVLERYRAPATSTAIGGTIGDGALVCSRDWRNVT